MNFAAPDRDTPNVSDFLRELRREAKNLIRCDTCDRTPDSVEFRELPATGEHMVVALCAHGSAKPSTDEWRRAVKIDSIKVDDEDVLMQPKTWRREFVFFRRGFACYPRAPRRGGVRPLPAYERRALMRP